MRGACAGPRNGPGRAGSSRDAASGPPLSLRSGLLMRRRGRSHATLGRMRSLGLGAHVRRPCPPPVPGAHVRRLFPVPISGAPSRRPCPAPIPGAHPRRSCSAPIPGAHACRSCPSPLRSAHVRRPFPMPWAPSSLGLAKRGVRAFRTLRCGRSTRVIPSRIFAPWSPRRRARSAGPPRPRVDRWPGRSGRGPS